MLLRWPDNCSPRLVKQRKKKKSSHAESGPYKGRLGVTRYAGILFVG